MVKMICITSRPEGGAPEEIRDKWVGLVLPVEKEYSGSLGDVLTHEKIRTGDGYEIRWEDAMEALDVETRKWWEENVFGISSLIFLKNCCFVVS